jgi:serine/threonine protein kinase/WD40 repeat protein
MSDDQATEINAAASSGPAAAFSELASDLNPGGRIGRYKLLQKLGEGGCGVVFMAEQEQPVKRRVALKVIKLGMDTRQVVARFEAERQALAMMDHPNIARVLDAGATESGRPYFVMELVRGVRITDFCDQNKAGARERLELFIQVCGAIQHAHQKGIIHRDIKPSNILVTLHDGLAAPKVIDFGIAKATQQQLTEKTLFTEIQQFIGTPAYMSPEQAELSGLDIDTRSDIYSLGVLLYELLTGRTPFDPKALAEAGLDEVRRRIREDEPARPSTRLSTLAGAEQTEIATRRRSGAPELIGLLRGDLDWIVMRCLEKNRSRRYETASDLAQDIKRFLANEPISARPPSTAYRLQKFARRHKAAIASAFAISFFLSAGLAASTISFIKERKARARAESAEQAQTSLRQQAEKARELADRRREEAAFQQKRAEENALAARRALYAADMSLAQHALKANNLGRARRLLDRHRPGANDGNTHDLRGWEWRYLWAQCQSDAIQVFTNRESRVLSAAISRDGSFMAAGFFDGWAGIWKSDGQLLQVIQTNQPIPFLAFSPVENRLAVAGTPQVVRVLDLAAGSEQLFHLGENARFVSSVTFSRDGTKLAALCADGDAGSRLLVWDSDSGEMISTASIEGRGSLHLGRLCFSADGETIYLGASGPDVEARRVADGSQVFRVKGVPDASGDGGLTAIAASPAADLVVTAYGFSESVARVWNGKGELIAVLEGHAAWIGDLNFSLDGKRLISAGADQTLRLWDTSTWQELATIRGHGDEVHAAVFSPNGRFALSGSKDGQLLFWDLDKPPAATSHAFVLPERVNSANLLPGGRHAVIAPANATRPVIFDLEARVNRPLDLPETGSFNFSPPDLLVHYDQQRWLTFYQISSSGARQAARIEIGADLQGGDFAREEEVLAYGLKGVNRVEMASLKSPGVRKSVTAASATQVSPVRLFDGARKLLAITDRFEVVVWDTESGESIPLPAKVQLPNPFQRITNERGSAFAFAAYAPDSRQYFLCFFHRSGGAQPVWRTLADEPPTSLAASPDGKLVALSTPTGKARIYDAVTGELLQSLHGHLNSVADTVFSPDSLRLATGSAGREAIKLWDVVSGQEVFNLEIEGGALLGHVEFSEDGNTLLAGRRVPNAPAFVWRAPSWEQVASTEKLGRWSTAERRRAE